MSIDKNYYKEDSSTACNTYIELQTLPRKPRRRRPTQYTSTTETSGKNKGFSHIATGMASQTTRKNEKKPGLKERIFGTRRISKGKR